jgi:lipopolysaccharide assembly protein A
MRILIRVVWLVVFLLLFAFAVTNTASTELNFVGSMVWRAPLVVLLLVFFLAGFVFGVIALMPGWVRMQIELRRLRRLNASVNVPVPGPDGQVAQDNIQSVALGARTTS